MVALMKPFRGVSRLWRSLTVVAALAAACAVALLPHGAHAAARAPVAHSAVHQVCAAVPGTA